MCVAGHPNQIFICLPFVALWAGARVADHAGADLLGLVRRARGPWGSAPLLGAGVAAAQLLVMAAQLPASVNTSGRTVLQAADPGLALTPGFIPSALLGQTWAKDPGSSSGTFESLGFVGVTVCLLALLGVGVTLTAKRWRATGVALVLATVLGILLALGPECQLDSTQSRVCQPGGRLYRTFFDSIPGFGQARVPGRWILLTALRARDPRRHRRRRPGPPRRQPDGAPDRRGPRPGCASSPCCSARSRPTTTSAHRRRSGSWAVWSPSPPSWPSPCDRRSASCRSSGSA